MSIITCNNCGAQYDGSNFPAGQQFKCTNCGAAVVAGAAPQQQVRAPQQQQARVAQQRRSPTGHVPRTPQGGGARRVPAQGARQQQPQQQYRGGGQPQMAAQQRAPQQGYPQQRGAPRGAMGWVQPSRTTKVRGIGMPILWYILTSGLYGLFWMYYVHQELPRRHNDWSGGQFLARAFLLPLIGVILGVVIVAAAGASNTPALIFVGMAVYGAAVVMGVVFQYMAYHKLTKRINAVAQAYMGQPEPVNYLFAILSIIVGPLIIAWWVQFQGTMDKVAAYTSRITLPPPNMNPQQAYAQRGPQQGYQ